ncbi:hypothetical protein AB6A40_002204 [Gnathostoma spinigerum]|uniref:Uncharacterized protein n=1 Tax=Gnathostoma spinigerum TaxID=75299 RepID=A0ABD6EGP9_9BILA
MDNGAVAEDVSVLLSRCKLVERKMQDRHVLVPKEVFLHPAGMSPEDDVVMEGYLFKRATNAFKTWHRRWFQVKDNKLLYCHRSMEQETPTVMEDDLKLCLVRPAPPSVERSCCFELVTPTKSHLLQADSETLCIAWMRALQRTIHHLHESDDQFARSALSMKSISQHPSNHLSKEGSVLAQLHRIPGNEICADCGADLPKWVSINLGVLLCIECCGIHRSLGVQVSKVRSLTMDTLEQEQKKLVTVLGNRLINSVYLKNLPKDDDVLPPPAKPNSSRTVREAWIKAKYVERRFVKSRRRISRAGSNLTQLVQSDNHNVTRSSSLTDINVHPVMEHNAINRSVDLPSTSSGAAASVTLEPCVVSGEEVLKAASEDDVLKLACLVAEGVDISATFSDTTALHMAVKHGHGVAVEFLLLNGMKANVLDGSLNTPLHIAAAYAWTLIVCQLLKRGADQRIKNHLGETALDVAVDGKHADIVTLLRVHEMRDEFTEEFNNPMDETVDDVMHDLTQKVDCSSY